MTQIASEVSPGFQFKLRTVFLIVGAAAIITASAAAPGRYASAIFLCIALVMPGVLATIAFSGGAYAKAFCLPALVPLIFSLHSLGWAFGWTVFNSTGISDLLAWFGTAGGTIKIVTLSSWVYGGFAGTICICLRRLLETWN